MLKLEVGLGLTFAPRGRLMLSYRRILKQFLTISAACSAFTLGLVLTPGGVELANAQSKPTKSGAPIAPVAPKNAPIAPASTASASASASAAIPAPNPPSSAPSDAASPTSAPENTTPPALTPTVAQPPGPPPEIVAQWRAFYERGKAAMATGSFPLASRMLNDVARQAPDPTLQLQARELADLATYWSRNRYILMPPNNTLPPGMRPKAFLPNERSIDELAFLYTNSLIWGTGFGVVVGFASDNADPSTFFLPAIGMSALGAGAVALMDVKFGPIPYGVPQSITSGMYMGFEAGFYLAAILEGERLVDDEEKVLPGLVWGSMTAGALIGGLVSMTSPTTPGRASFTSTGALWGGLLSSLVTVGFLDGDFDSAPFVTGLIGAAAGGVTTGLLGSSISPSIARVRFIDVGAVGGGLVFGGLYASISDRFDGQALAFLTSAGIVAGIATSAYLTRDMDRDEPRRGNPPKTASWRMSPYMMPQPGGGTLGFSGTF